MPNLINPRDEKHNDLLKNLQGNILKGHGREHTANIFITCQKGKEKVCKTWIKSLVDKGFITSAKKQIRDNFLFKDNQIDGGMFGTILFSAAGYKYLSQDISKFSNEFQHGMKNAALNDPILAKWEDGFQKEIHFLLLIGDTNRDKLRSESRVLMNEIEDFGSVTNVEYGNALKNDDGAGIEHFGYVDGTSQPIFFEDELKSYKENNNIKAGDKFYDPSADRKLVLVDDPLIRHKDAFGSYFVFRKLEQNVKGFKDAEEELGKALGLKGEDAERAGAMIVGRFEDGTPVQISDEAGMIKSYVVNNFDYDVADASKCPFHAHIRKANPRSANPHENLEKTQSHVMARRGIPFGERSDNPNDGLIENKPTECVGLLFMSYQASIGNQFEFIQQNWVNNENFPSANDGIDPIIGQDGNQNISTGAFPVKYGVNNPSNFQTESFAAFVSMKGGEYFFAPSIPFLEKL
jgi:Dyp-type peroxidase family